MSFKVSKYVEKLNKHNIAVRQLERVGVNRRMMKIGHSYTAVFDIETSNISYDCSIDEDAIGGVKLGKFKPYAGSFGRVRRKR